MGRIDCKELAEWMAFDNIEPFGDRMADLRMARICHTMASAWCKTPGKLEDYLLVREPRKPQTEEEMKKILQLHEKAMKAGARRK